MAIPLYLAMTSVEFSGCLPFPAHPAWMSCHFSPGGPGLSNLPACLPEGCLLILDDRLPPSGHDPQQIRRELQAMVETQNCAGLLLDFQRLGDPETDSVAAELLQLPCPVCVSKAYAQGSCPVLLPPCPLTVPLTEHLAPWRGREIWLEAAPDSALFRITKAGCHTLFPPQDLPLPHYDPALFCRYGIEAEPDDLLFSLCRSKEDMLHLLEAAETAGVTAAIGLYQELCP